MQTLLETVQRDVKVAHASWGAGLHQAVRDHERGCASKRSGETRITVKFTARACSGIKRRMKGFRFHLT